MKLDYSKIVNGFFLSCAAAGIAYLGFTKYYEKELDFCKDYPHLIEVNEDIEKTYYKDIDKDSLQYDMIDGLINGLDDRFSFYNSIKKVNENCVNNSIMLKTNGFQVGQDEKSKRMVITEVEPDSVAEKQGMSVGDFIIAINDTVIQRNGYHNSIELILGKKDAPVRLVCSHDGKIYEVTIKSGADQQAESQTLSNKMYDNGVYYYYLPDFDASADTSFEHEISEIRNDIKGLILDLRDNGGGATDATVKFFDLFYGSGCSVKTVCEKSGKVEIYETSDGVKYDFPVVVLVSEKSLSSSEIIAAFFQETGRGTVMGTVTGGKGVFQSATTLEDYSTYGIVAGYYYVNDLPNYDGVGITPDIIVEMDPELIGTEDDVQLKKAIELLS